MDLPRTLVLAYLNDSRRNLPELQAVLIAGDYERARVFGHQMKATGCPYGFPDLTTLGTAIERAAVQQDALELDRLFHQLEGYLGRVGLAAE
jgi:hypothetical protein